MKKLDSGSIWSTICYTAESELLQVLQGEWIAWDKIYKNISFEIDNNEVSHITGIYGLNTDTYAFCIGPFDSKKNTSTIKIKGKHPILINLTWLDERNIILSIDKALREKFCLTYSSYYSQSIFIGGFEKTEAIS